MVDIHTTPKPLDFVSWACPEREIDFPTLQEAVWTVLSESDYTGDYLSFISRCDVADIGLQWKTSRGKLPKRVAAWAKKHLALQVSSDALGRMSQYYDQCRACQIKIRFTRDFDWTPGTWGEYTDSCWWCGNKNARPALHAAGGYAIQYKLNGTPGRCWYHVPSRCDYAVLFNAYGPLSCQNIARVLANEWSMVSVVAHATNKPDPHKLIYINQGHASLVGTDTLDMAVNLLIPTDGYRLCQCCNGCGNYVEDFVNVDFNDYCQQCQ